MIQDIANQRFIRDQIGRGAGRASRRRRRAHDRDGARNSSVRRRRDPGGEMMRPSAYWYRFLTIPQVVDSIPTGMVMKAQPAQAAYSSA